MFKAMWRFCFNRNTWEYISVVKDTMILVSNKYHDIKLCKSA